MTYAEALKESRKAEDVYYLALADYRFGKIGDDEYLKARAAYEKSEVAFDAALAAERARSGNTPTCDDCGKALDHCECERRY